MTNRNRSKGASEIRGLHSRMGQRLSPRIEGLLTSQIAGAIVLFLSSLIALIWANSPWKSEYFALCHQTITIDLGVLTLSKTLQHWINDGLMAIFFFIVGLEIKHEFVLGGLASPKKAALPIFAAVGGMVFPALIFTGFNSGTPLQVGWGIPMATDIAFALGVYGLVARRFPLELRIFLLAIAVTDDIGAVLVIALFYTEQFSLVAMTFSAIVFAGVLFLRALGYRPILGYVAIGILFWIMVLKSGVHATIAGVILGLLTPAKPLISKADFLSRIEDLLKVFKKAEETDSDEAERTFGRIEILVRETESPLSRLERLLQPWNVFVVLPVFALVNAGVTLDFAAITEAVRHPVANGIVWGLLVGKPVGILLMSYIGVKSGLCELPKNVSWTGMTGVSFLAGIGFTVSLFITGLAYLDQSITAHAKVGVFAGSIVSAVIGVLVFRFSGRLSKGAVSN